jgi:uncharacterized protein YndB with AHSA1/START domain
VTEDLGVLSESADGWRLTYTRALAHPPERVWRVITEPDHLAVWFPDRIEGELRADARVRFVTSDDGDGFDGEVVVFDPPRVIELRWGDDVVRIELMARDGGTMLTFTDTFGELGRAARDGAGWHECVDRLVARVEGDPPLDWAVRYRAIHPVYVAAFGPEASTVVPPPDWAPTTE